MLCRGYAWTKELCECLSVVSWLQPMPPLAASGYPRAAGSSPTVAPRREALWPAQAPSTARPVVVSAAARPSQSRGACAWGDGGGRAGECGLVGDSSLPSFFYLEFYVLDHACGGRAGECGLVGDLLDYAQYHISFEELFFQVTSVRVSLRRNGSPRHAGLAPRLGYRYPRRWNRLGC